MAASAIGVSIPRAPHSVKLSQFDGTGWEGTRWSMLCTIVALDLFRPSFLENHRLHRASQFDHILSIPSIVL